MIGHDPFTEGAHHGNLTNAQGDLRLGTRGLHDLDARLDAIRIKAEMLRPNAINHLSSVTPGMGRRQRPMRAATINEAAILDPPGQHIHRR